MESLCSPTVEATVSKAVKSGFESQYRYERLGKSHPSRRYECASRISVVRVGILRLLRGNCLGPQDSNPGGMEPSDEGGNPSPFTSSRSPIGTRLSA